MPQNELAAKMEVLPVFEYRGQLVADSRDVAAMIGRQHKDTLRTISTMCKHLSGRKIALADFFIKATYRDEQGKPRPCYYLTEMGCEMVANKQTGEAGTIFTAQYVKAFHAMRDFIRERQSPIWQDTRSLGKEIRKMETDAIKALVAYAEAQGSRHATRYYQSISSLANRTAGIVERDKAHTVELFALLIVEKIIEQEIRTGIEARRPYKDIYSRLNEKLHGLRPALAPQRPRERF